MTVSPTADEAVLVLVELLEDPVHVRDLVIVVGCRHRPSSSCPVFCAGFSGSRGRRRLCAQWACWSLLTSARRMEVADSSAALIKAAARTRSPAEGGGYTQAPPGSLSSACAHNSHPRTPTWQSGLEPNHFGLLHICPCMCHTLFGQRLRPSAVWLASRSLASLPRVAITSSLFILFL